MADEQKHLVHQIVPLLESEDKSSLKELLSNQRSSDIAEVVELVDNDERRIIFDAMDRPTSAEVLEKVDEATRSELFELLKDFPHTLSISAHSHKQDHRFFHEGASDWQQATPHHHFNVGTTSGSWWNGLKNEKDVPHTMMRDGTPNGYSFISFKGTEYIIDWKVSGSPEDHQMNIYVPRGIVAGSEEETLLMVNFFNGSEQSKLDFRIKGHTEWIPMTKVLKKDPYYSKIAKRWTDFSELGFEEMAKENLEFVQERFPGTPLGAADICTHLWEANIGTDWPAGRHLIEVRAHDRYGRTFNAFHTMRVVEGS
jgi:hypothetical protein